MNKELLRSQTPACEYKIHLNNAGAALCPQPVINAIQNYFDIEHKLGGYEAMMLRANHYGKFYSSAARLLNAKSRNIAFVQHSTDALNRALSSIALQPGDCIITTEYDYHSFQMAFLQLQKRFGIQLLRCPSSRQGGYDPIAMEQLMSSHQPKIVCIAHVPTNSGLIQDVIHLGKLCETHKAIYIIDACQSIGQLPLDVEKYKCDFLCASTRKFLRGPRGAGLLYVSDKILEAGMEPMFLDGQGALWTGPDTYKTVDDAKRFETWERSYALMEGTTAAIDYALEVGMEEIAAEVQHLASYVRSALQTIPEARVLDQGENLCGIATVHFENKNPDDILNYLLKKNINTSIARKNHAVIDFDKKEVEWALRIAPHYYNTIEELDTTIEFLRKL